MMNTTRRPAHPARTRLLPGIIALLYFTGNCALGHATETNMWAERRKTSAPIQVASAGMDLTAIMGRMPSASSARLSDRLAAAHGTGSAADTLAAALPQRAGTVRRIARAAGPERGTVLHIQDVHMNREAQANIAEAVRAVSKDAGVGVIGLEGASGSIELARFQRFEDRESVGEAARFLLEQGKISGPVFSAMTGTSPAVEGIDDAALYRQNVDAYLASTAAMPRERLKAEQERADLAGQKAATFNAKLLAFDRVVTAQRDGNMAFGDYVEAVARQNASVTKNVRSFIDALALERRLDFNRVERERESLLRDLIVRLSKEEVASLGDRALAYRVGRLSDSAFYAELAALCGRHDLPLAKFPAMNDFIKYLLAADRIDGDHLFAELKGLEESAYAALTTSDAERSLLKADRRAYLTTRLIQFAMTPDEWAEYAAGGESPALASFEDFYKTAHLRDGAMARRLVDAMDRARAKNAVIVTGGFHARGLVDQLTAGGYTVVTFVPRITRMDEALGADALSVFTQEKTPLEKLFAGERLFLAPAPMIDARVPATLAAAVAERRAPGRFIPTLKGLSPDIADGSQVVSRSALGVSARVMNAMVNIRFSADGKLSTIGVAAALATLTWAGIVGVAILQTATVSLVAVTAATAAAFAVFVLAARRADKAVGAALGALVPEAVPAWRRFIGLGAVLIALILSGCATPNRVDLSLPYQVPGSYSSNASLPGNGANADGWLDKVGDSTLKGLVAEALQKNPNIKIANANMKEANALLKKATGALFPSVTGSMLVFGQQRGNTPWGVESIANVNLSLDLDYMGELRAMRAAAKADQLAQASYTEYVQQAVAADVARAYFTLIEARDRISVVNADIATLKKRQATLQQRLDAGQIAPSAVNRVNGDLQMKEAEARGLTSAAGDAAAALQKLVGRYPDAQIQSGRFPSVAPVMPSGVPMTVLLNRPDVRWAALRAYGSSDQVWAAFAQQFPKIGIRVGTETPVWPNGALGTAVNFAGNLFTPLINRQAIRANLKIAEAEQAKAEAAYVQQATEAFGQVEGALRDQSLLKERIGFLQGAVKERQQEFEALQAQADMGLKSQTEASDAMERLSQAKTALVQAQSLAARNYINLHQSLGGSFQARNTGGAWFTNPTYVRFAWLETPAVFLAAIAVQLTLAWALPGVSFNPVHIGLVGLIAPFLFYFGHLMGNPQALGTRPVIVLTAAKAGVVLAAVATAFVAPVPAALAVTAAGIAAVTAYHARVQRAAVGSNPPAASLAEAFNALLRGLPLNRDVETIGGRPSAPDTVRRLSDLFASQPAAIRGFAGAMRARGIKGRGAAFSALLDSVRRQSADATVDAVLSESDQPGGGTIVALPAAKVDGAEGVIRALAGSQSDTGPRSVVVVEDEASAAKVRGWAGDKLDILISAEPFRTPEAGFEVSLAGLDSLLSRSRSAAWTAPSVRLVLPAGVELDTNGLAPDSILARLALILFDPAMKAVWLPQGSVQNLLSVAQLIATQA